MKEVAVTAVKAAVVARQDTLEFNAGSYATPKQNATAEDLPPRKLPGVQGGSDYPSITSNGQDRKSKILVDGKSEFGVTYPHRSIEKPLLRSWSTKRR